jgi:site-specific DNA recombinase
MPKANRSNAKRSKNPSPSSRVAIYARLSVADQDKPGYTSIDHQVDSCRSYIHLRKPDGWDQSPEVFVDEGHSGGTLQRPRFQELLRRVKEGEFAAVVVHKFDRICRSLSDFLNLADLFTRLGVTLASATEHIDVSTPVGKAFRNIMMTFAEMEREMARVRAKEKRTASVKKGRWPGGNPMLGYDRGSDPCLLVVNEAEAERVREVFDIYLKERSLSRTARVLNGRAWRTKEWTTRAGNSKGGHKFTKTNVAALLRNPIYVGKLRHDGQLYDGNHTPIVNPKAFARAQRHLDRNGTRRTSPSQNKHNFLLGGLVICAACGSHMTPNFAHSKGRKYFYYKCTSVDHLDKSACPVRSVPARALEDIVIERLSVLAEHDELLQEMADRAQSASRDALPKLRKERADVETSLRRVEKKARRLLSVLEQEGDNARTSFPLQRLQELEEEEEQLQTQLSELDGQMVATDGRVVETEAVRDALREFNTLLGKLTPQGQIEAVHLVVRQVVYDEQNGQIRLLLRPLPGLEEAVRKSGADIEGVGFDESGTWLAAVRSRAA